MGEVICSSCGLVIDKIYDYDTLTVTIDCCYAGQFIDDLSKKNRIIITGTDEDSIGYIHNGIGCLFSNAVSYTHLTLPTIYSV